MLFIAFPIQMGASSRRAVVTLHCFGERGVKRPCLGCELALVAYFILLRARGRRGEAEEARRRVDDCWRERRYPGGQPRYAGPLAGPPEAGARGLKQQAAGDPLVVVCKCGVTCLVAGA